MTRQVFDGANYGFLLPDGTSGQCMNGYVQTSRGRVEFPGENLLRLDGTIWNGALWLVGEGNATGHAWLWNGAGWRDCGPTIGVGTCAFGTGVLCVCRSGDTYHSINLDTGEITEGHAAFGSQGIRYVNDQNLPIPGDASMFDGVVHEFTDRGDVRVGQGHDFGTLANGRLLEGGDCYFPKFKRDGDRLAVYIVQFKSGRGVGHLLSRADVDRLPMPAPHPPPPPPPPPPPTKEPPVSINHLDTLQRVRAKYPEKIDAVQAVAILNETTWEHRDEGLGLLRKDGGNHGPQPTTGILCSCDWIVNSKTGTGGDCLVKGPDSTIGELNIATPTWNDGTPFDQSHFVQPVAPDGTVPPGPNPPPSGSSFAAAAGELEVRIANLTRTVQEQGKLIAALEAKTGEHTSSLTGKRVALRTDNGHYVCAEGGGSGEVNATRPNAGSWETFTLEEQGYVQDMTGWILADQG